MDIKEFVNIFWAVMSVIAELLSVGIIALIFIPKLQERFPTFTKFVSKRSLLIAFTAALLATLGSLAYSDIFGFNPCKLCWIQRIFMYPNVILLGIGLWKKDTGIALYSMALSGLGGIVAFYHYMSQNGFDPLNLPCNAIGYSETCAKVFVLTFGYITIPIMALSAFILIFLVLMLGRKRNFV